MLKKNEKKKYEKQPNGNVYNWLISCDVILNLQSGKNIYSSPNACFVMKNLKLKKNKMAM